MSRHLEQRGNFQPPVERQPAADTSTRKARAEAVMADEILAGKLAVAGRVVEQPLSPDLFTPRNFFYSTEDIYAYPTSAIQDEQELTAYCAELFRQVGPTSFDQARFDHNLGQIRPAVAYFDDVIARQHIVETVSVEIVDPSITPENFNANQPAQNRTKELTRRIWVRVFPNMQTAQSEYEQHLKNIQDIEDADYLD